MFSLINQKVKAVEEQIVNHSKALIRDVFKFLNTQGWGIIIVLLRPLFQELKKAWTSGEKGMATSADHHLEYSRVAYIRLRMNISAYNGAVLSKNVCIW